MDDRRSRREAAKAYKERDAYGGLYRIVNTQTGWQSDVMSTPNLEGKRNSVQFGINTNYCFDAAIKDQWAQFGAKAFAFVEVERLKRKPDQTGQEFREELRALLALWQENG